MFEIIIALSILFALGVCSFLIHPILFVLLFGSWVLMILIDLGSE